MFNRLPATPCRVCGAKLDAATIPGKDATPRPGDVSVCFYCGAVSIFTATLERRALTAAEIIEVERLPAFRRMHAAVRRRIDETN